ncbi:hypothetical protein ACF1DV_37615, partial [Streptomyces achromogenes]|uniref:hypothetical protein n=1 Tax=Streptomyces achromogenes TaxID=67255 RepID=UPI0036F6FE52
MTTETPRDDSGEPLCAWCGGPVQQSGIGRRREYCSRTHREYAYRARRDREMRLRAYSEGRADERRLSSTDGTPDGPVSTVDETASVPAPLP